LPGGGFEPPTFDPTVQFRPGQWEAIQALVEGRERLLVVERTGWGKSIVNFIATRLLRDRRDLCGTSHPSRLSRYSAIWWGPPMNSCLALERARNKAYRQQIDDCDQEIAKLLEKWVRSTRSTTAPEI
jgi:hypothetical protein